ncbi:helix-turn-helix domain-containing protein [Natronococcus wangiae]|uniref:helix-turn-helix domain-containing protein n=1 Tax=Natronococcus wangiae TaxID=3068275 RepID=UPI00273F545A|nr:helix-turn-helix domain-containing protein [Natronococcus sp. AD5]
MSVIATITVPASSFSLGSLVDAETVTVRIETTVPTSESVIPYLWVPADVTESIVSRLESKAAVDRVAVVDEADGSVLVKVAWNDGVNGILEAIRESDAIVTSAAGTADRWTFRLRLPSYEDLSTFYARCLESNVEVELVRLHEAVAGDDPSQFGLTDAQRRLIVAAYEAGYFDVPRRTTLVELGERFDVSDSAVSQQLRRGLAALVDSTVRIEARSDDIVVGRGAEPTEPASETGNDP